MKPYLLLTALLLSLTGCTATATKTLPVTPVTPNTPAETEFITLQSGYNLIVTYGSEKITYYANTYMTDIQYKTSNLNTFTITVNYNYSNLPYTDVFSGPTVSYAVRR